MDIGYGVTGRPTFAEPSGGSFVPVKDGCPCFALVILLPAGVQNSGGWRH